MTGEWKETTLGEICNIQQGKTIALSSLSDGSYPVYGANGIVGQIDEYNFDFHLTALGCRGSCGTVHFIDQKAFLSGNVMAIWQKSDQELLPKYIPLALSALDLEGSGAISGQVQPQITKTSLSPVPISVPSIPEQKRIVDLITSMDSYIEQLKRYLASLRLARQSSIDKFVNFTALDFTQVKISQIVDLNPEQAKDAKSARMIRYIDLSKVSIDSGIAPNIVPVPFSEAPGRARRTIRTDDVLVSTVRPYLRGFAMVEEEYNGEIASTGFCVLRPNSQVVNPDLLWAVIRSERFVSYLVGKSTGSNYPAVRPADIGNFSFGLPALEVQHSLADLFNAMDESVSKATQTLEQSQMLREAILESLLTQRHEIPQTYDKFLGGEA